MNWIIAFLPAVGWGLIPIIAGKIPQSKPKNEIYGTGMGAVITSIIFTIIMRPNISSVVFLLAIVAGIGWAVGQIGQFISFTNIGVTKTMPISAGLQLIGSCLIGGLLFHEWNSSRKIMLGLLALVLMIVGVFLTSLSKDHNGQNKVKDFLLLLFTSIGFWVYASFPKAVTANGRELFLPEMLGILLGAILYLVFAKKDAAFKQKASYLNILVGISFSIGACAYIFSVERNGVATAFIYSQLAVVIATLGGMYILNDRKHGKSLFLTLAGLALIVVGSFIS
ncbi:GRP family sugar transporter [Lactobacillaceae bacterium 24-114]